MQDEQTHLSNILHLHPQPSSDHEKMSDWPNDRAVFKIHGYCFQKCQGYEGKGGWKQKH